ncbi:hypothetical protein PCASD_14265 [Puccinia coronata f. sp. avenae]|uniref:Uncharacterized protein n=1 Tax=Puccinia coronata f. sp. avenae TaxID=200324 RepID=A0A2N5TFC2_9BASI|nr:hypothetical protein PCASD_14265 [Puccinia coronata f. sp. avenae]
MGAHLRNGKNISFKQQAAAAAAAARDQLHAEQKRTEEQQLAKQYYTGQQYPDQYPSSQLVTPANKATSVTTSGQQLGVLQETPWLPPTEGELPRGSITSERPTPAHQSGPESPSARNGSLYNPSPSALERLRRAREQFTPVDGFRRAGSADGRTSSLQPPPRMERQDFLVTRQELQPPPPRETASTTPVQNQLVLREMTDAPLPPDPAETILDVFHGQWLLFVNAKEQDNQPMMRLALTQEIFSQDALERLLGTQRMLEISEGWIAREELVLLDQDSQALTTHHQETAPLTCPTTNQYHQSQALQQGLPLQNNQLMHPDGNTQMRPALVQQHQAQPAQLPPLLVLVPTRPPTGLHTVAATAEHYMPPHQDNTTHPRRQIAPPAPYQTHPYYGQTYYANQPRQHQLEYQPHEQYLPPRGGHQYNKPQQHSGPQYHRPYQRNRENTWRRRYDPMANMMQMGTFFMRAERTLSRMQRLRYRGRSYRGNLGNNQAPPPPGNFQ